MLRCLQPLCLLLLRATGSELAQMVEYLKAENRIPRSKLPERITGTPRERGLHRAWVAQQARNFAMHLAEQGLEIPT